MSSYKKLVHTLSERKQNTLESPVKPSLTLGISRMCTGAWGFMSLKAKTWQENDTTKYEIHYTSKGSADTKALNMGILMHNIKIHIP